MYLKKPSAQLPIHTWTCRRFQHATQIKKGLYICAELINCWTQTNGGTADVWGSWICRYNVSCSQHYKTSRGRTGVGLTSLPAPNDSAARRRGPSRRSSSNTSLNNLSSRHLPVKVRSVVQPARCKNLFFCCCSISFKVFFTSNNTVAIFTQRRAIANNFDTIMTNMIMQIYSSNYDWAVGS